MLYIGTAVIGCPNFRTKFYIKNAQNILAVILIFTTNKPLILIKFAKKYSKTFYFKYLTNVRMSEENINYSG